VLPSAARFYDRKHDRSFTVNVLMLDTGASGGLLGEHVTRSEGVPWQATPGMTIKGAGSERQSVLGRALDLSLLLLPGTPHAVSVNFNALIMPGVEGTYDAVLGREQQHALGLMFDSYTMSCTIRPKLAAGLDFSVQLPISCCKESLARATANGSQPVACAAVGYDSLRALSAAVHHRLTESGTVEEHPGPTPGSSGRPNNSDLHTESSNPADSDSSNTSNVIRPEPVMVWSPSTRLTPAEVRQLDIACRELLRAGRISQAFSTVNYCDDYVLLLNRRISYADLRALAGHVRYRLTQSGTVETDPGPIYHVNSTTEVLSRPHVVRAATLWMLALLPLIAVVSASAGALIAAAHKDFEAAAVLTLVMWGTVGDCCVVLAEWANCHAFPVPCFTAPMHAAWDCNSRRRKRHQSSPLPRMTWRPAPLSLRSTKYFGAGMLMLVYLLTCYTVCTTAMQASSAIMHGMTSAVRQTDLTAANPVSCQQAALPLFDLLAGEVDGNRKHVTGCHAAADCFAGYDTTVMHPGQLLESLDPSGERDAHDSQQYYIDQDGQFRFAYHNDYTADEQQPLQEAVRQRKHAFAYSAKELPGFHGLPGQPCEVGWKLKHDLPIRVPCHARRFSPAEQAVLDEKCKELEEAGLITEIPSTNKYAFMPVLAAKKDAVTHEWTQLHMCINYQRLNQAMVTDAYNPPLPEDIFARAAQCRIF
jgi:hypothetical protein